MEERKWRREMPSEMLHSKDIHVWRAFLDVHSLHFENLLEILSDDEVERAGRFHFEKDRKHFIVARGILRQLLGYYLEKDPRTLCFEYTTFGKPLLSTNNRNDNIQFNVSHSSAFALYAFTPDRSIGIDIERIREDVVVDQIAKRFFSQSEINSLERIEDNMRAGAFFQYWTRKEAFLKAIGEGVSFPMDQCDVSLMSGHDMSPVTLLGGHRENAYWYGQDLFPGSGYAAAIAVERDNWELSFWDYNQEMPPGH